MKTLFTDESKDIGVERLEFGVEDAMELIAMEQELDTLSVEIATDIDLVKRTETILENLNTSMENDKLALESDSITDITVKMSLDALKSTKELLGDDSVDNIALESSELSLEEQLTISLEEKDNIFVRAYKAIKKFIANIWKKIKEFFKKIFKSGEKQSETAAKIETKLLEHKEEYIDVETVVTDDKPEDDKSWESTVEKNSKKKPITEEDKVDSGKNKVIEEKADKLVNIYKDLFLKGKMSYEDGLGTEIINDLGLRVFLETGINKLDGNSLLTTVSSVMNNKGVVLDDIEKLINISITVDSKKAFFNKAKGIMSKKLGRLNKIKGMDKKLDGVLYSVVDSKATILFTDGNSNKFTHRTLVFNAKDIKSVIRHKNAFKVEEILNILSVISSNKNKYKTVIDRVTALDKLLSTNIEKVNEVNSKHDVTEPEVLICTERLNILSGDSMLLSDVAATIEKDDYKFVNDTLKILTKTASAYDKLSVVIK